MMLREEWIGKKVRVVKSANTALQGISGTIINETKHLVEVQTSSGIKKIPKHNTLFAFTINTTEEFVDGSKAEVSPEERVKIKE